MAWKRHLTVEERESQKADAKRRKAEYGRQRRLNMSDEKRAAIRNRQAEIRRQCLASMIQDF